MGDEGEVAMGVDNRVEIYIGRDGREEDGRKGEGAKQLYIVGRDEEVNSELACQQIATSRPSRCRGRHSGSNTPLLPRPPEEPRYMNAQQCVG